MANLTISNWWFKQVISSEDDSLYWISGEKMTMWLDFGWGEVFFLDAQRAGSPDTKQQRRGMIGLTLNDISNQFFARFLFLKKLSCHIFWPALITNLSCVQSRICSVNCFLLKTALAVLTLLLEISSLTFLFYLFVIFFELFIMTSLSE